MKASEIRYKEDAETVTFKFPSTLSVGVAKLSLEFTGVLNDKMKGFYRSKYTSLTGEERYAAVTQFEVGCFLIGWSIYFNIFLVYNASKPTNKKASKQGHCNPSQNILRPVYEIE